METEKGTQEEIEPGGDREPQKDTARNTESQKQAETETQRGRVRERYRPRETET